MKHQVPKGKGEMIHLPKEEAISLHSPPLNPLMEDMDYLRKKISSVMHVGGKTMMLTNV